MAVYNRRPEAGRLSKEEIAAIITSDVKKDLHMHTCYSDGAMTPQEIIDKYIGEGYELISITDHDGIEGSVIGMDYAMKMPIGFISGIEFDSHDPLGKDLHILGYGIDYDDERLRAVLWDVILKRARRNDRMMAALNDMGCGITLDDIGEINEGRYVGKPTFAKILAKKGIVPDMQQAFTTLFREPSVRSIVKETLTSKEIIEVIHEAGGLAVFAHPMEQRHLGESFADFEPRLMALLETMLDYGVDGIEVRHPSADEKRVELFSNWADAHGLLKTEGSDFHKFDTARDFARYHGE